MLDYERSLYEKRVRSFIARLEGLVYQRRIPLKMKVRVTDEPIMFAHRLEGDYRSIGLNDIWGRAWQSAWFHLQGRLPKEWAGSRVIALLNFTGEACVFSESGIPLRGLAGHSIFHPEFVRERYPLFSSCSGGESVDLWIEAAANGLFGVDKDKDPPRDDPERHGHFEARVKAAHVAVFREDLWHLLLDARVLNDLMVSLPKRSVRRSRLIRALSEAIDIFSEDEQSASEARRRLERELQVPASLSDLATTAVGHAHIDTAWLWPVRESIRKCARTFSTQLALLDRYPTYVFGASQAQHYRFVKEHYPALYEKIREKIAEGRWEIQGAMWVEADNNLISGESIVRQILHGKNFFRQEFGVEVKNLWLPDVFGYSASLPQILKKSGIEYFVTQKISWSQFNRFPHHTFMWQGIDGSEVITHFPPEDSYNSELKADRLIYARENFAEKGYLDEFLTLFGVGDGGGGPKEEHIEMGLRQKNLEGAPRVSFDSAQSLLDRLGKQRDKLKTWVGELYLELHRGTLTTQARNKKMNRRFEIRLRQLEFYFSCLSLDSYPSKELDQLWKTLFLNQFHDIIPGSSIGPVYRDSQEDYRRMESATEELLRRAASCLFESNENALCVVNTLSYTYSRPVLLPDCWRGYDVVDENGKPLIVQEEAGPLVQIEVEPMSTRTLCRRKREVRPAQSKSFVKSSSHASTRREGLTLENALIRYEFDEEGVLTRCWDREASREALSAPSNILNLYEDRPADWDAWDIDIFYEGQLCERARPVSWDRVEGPLRAVLRFRYEVGASEIEQRIALDRSSKRLDFETEVSWRERHKMLRVAFFTTIIAQSARFDIPFGTLERGTHRNTPWDRARFEVCAHRFADLSDGDYGVALLNDCKYGYKVLGCELNLNLLRSPTYPDPDADLGDHAFTYSLLPHTGNLAASSVWSEAAQLNQPVDVFDGYEGSSLPMPLMIEGEGVVYEVLKKAEREEGIILRAYETRGNRTHATLKRNRGFDCFETDLMEDCEKKIDFIEDTARIEFSPFEIKTIKAKAL
jgi:alpha-mannosidase